MLVFWKQSTGSTSKVVGPMELPALRRNFERKDHLVGKNRVARLMKVAGIEGVSRRRKTRTTLRGQNSRPAPDLVERNFQVQPPQPTVGCRHHVRAELGRFRLPGRSGRRFQSSSGRLVAQK